jgi:hypothetical protein
VLDQEVEAVLEGDGLAVGEEAERLEGPAAAFLYRSTKKGPTT